MSATPVIAGAGLGLSVLSLAWQGYTWRSNGGKVRLAVGTSIPTFGAETGEAHAQCKIRNVGRGSIEVASWGVSIGSGNVVRWPESTQIANAPFPVTLAGGHVINVHVIVKWIAEARRSAIRDGTANATDSIRFWAELGNGKRVTTPFGFESWMG